MPTLNENIAQVKADFKGIRNELVNKGASIPSGTPTSQYANIIKNMSTGGSEEAYEQGRQDVIAESKYIEKSATGTFITLTDVSEVSHKVKVFGNGEVDVYGKNLFDISADTRFTEQSDGSYVNNVTLLNDKRTFVLPYNTYIVSYDISCPVGKNARMEFTLGDGTTVSTFTTSTGDFVHVEKTITGEIVNWYFGYASRPLEGELIIKNVQIEVGSTATAYEPCNKQTITATPMGTEVSSICPKMTFIADEEIKVDYYSSYGMAEKERAMWNAFTDYGKRNSFGRAFSYSDYTGYTIPSGLCKPTQTIGELFYAYKGTELPRGVDCSEFNTETTVASYYLNIFCYASNLKYIYDLGIPALKSYSACFRNCNNLETIEVIRVADWTTFDTNSFNGCTSLIRCIFSGILTSNLSMFHCKKLDDETLVSISVVLCDLVFSGFGDGWGSRTLTLSAESIARLKELPYPPDDLNPEGTPYAEDGASCYDVIAGRKGWNIA